MQTRNTRTGYVLFCIYLLLYGGFVLLNTFSPDTMGKTPFAGINLGILNGIAGINLAILYGFALIVTAFLLAMLYGWLCRSGRDSNGKEAGK